MPRTTSFDSFIWDLVKEDAGDRPIFAVDLDDVREKVDRWRSNFPRVIPFYAMKCNDSPRLLSTLAQLGCGFDCASTVSRPTSHPERATMYSIRTERTASSSGCRRDWRSCRFREPVQDEGNAAVRGERDGRAPHDVRLGGRADEDPAGISDRKAAYSTEG